MRVSISLRTSFPSDLGAVAGRWLVERARAAERAGLDALFVGDHHSTGPEAYLQNIPTMGRLLAEWGDRPFGALFLLPLWPPVLLAEQVGTLATLGEGRFVLQTAIGGGAEQFAGMGAPLQGRTKRFEAGLDVMRRLLAGETVTDESGTFGITGARVAPVPDVPVEIWIGATAEAGIDRAARLGDGWICNAHVIPSEAREQAEAYRRACDACGRVPTAVAIRRDVFVAETEAEGVRAAARAVESGYRGFRLDALTSGTVDQVVECFQEYAGMGYTDVVVRHFSDAQDEVLASIERLARVRAALARKP